ncbi:MAG: hypothetical protein BWX70_01468 [Verrucomicrobia bacterium ADurb.Bin070]|nr:MAG: hypothetical protein BWX70_01468 [Verrucomicrobia bacterium ADurb.Bin070]
MRRQHAVRKGESGLDDAGGAGSPECVTDVSFDRSDSDQWLSRASFAVNVLHHLDFGLVGVRHAGTMRLKQMDRVGRDISGVHGAADRAGQAFRRRHTLVLVERGRGDAGAADDGVDAVAGAQGILEAFEHKHGATLTGQGAVRLAAEGLEGFSS